MSLYTPRQLFLVLVLLGAAGAGMAIDHWRRARPDLVERLEGADRAERREASPPPPALARPPAGGPAIPRTLRANDERATRRRGAREPAPVAPLDVNHASQPEIERLPGIGPALASRIVAARPFAQVDDLRRVRGLRSAALERLRPLVTTLP